MHIDRPSCFHFFPFFEIEISPTLALIPFFSLSPILKFNIYISVLLGANLDILICMLFLTNPEINEF